MMEGTNQEQDGMEEDCWTGQTSPRTVELAERKYRPGILFYFIGGLPRHCDQWSIVLPILSSSWLAATAPPPNPSP